MLNKHNLSIAAFASKEASRYTLQGILVTPEATVATDGHRLVWVSGEPERESKDYPQVPGFAGASDSFKPFVLSRDAALAIAKVTPSKERIPILNHVAVAEDGSAMAITDLERPQVFPVRKVEGQFPKYDLVVPKWEDATFRVSVDASYLAEIAKAFAQFSSDRSHAVVLSFYKDKLVAVEGAEESIAQNSIRFDATNMGQGMTAVLMPIRDVEDKAGTYGWTERKAKLDAEREAAEAKAREDANDELRTDEHAEVKES